MGLIPGPRRSPGEGNGNLPTPVFLPGDSYGQRSLAGYSPWHRKESGMTEPLALSLLRANLWYFSRAGFFQDPWLDNQRAPAFLPKLAAFLKVSLLWYTLYTTKWPALSTQLDRVSQMCMPCNHDQDIDCFHPPRKFPKTLWGQPLALLLRPPLICSLLFETRFVIGELELGEVSDWG